MRAPPARPAWGLWAIAVLLVPCGPVLQTVANSDAILFSIGFVAIQLSTATVGALVASRLPGNAVGWIFLAMGVGLGVATTLSGYGELGVNTSTGPLPGDEIAAWLGEVTFVPVVFGGMVLLALLFPTGRFLTPRWRRVGIGGFAIVLLATLADGLAPGRLEGYSAIENPAAAGGWLADAVVALRSVTDAAALPLFIAAVAGLVVRLRRSRGVERQQLKWFTYAAAIAALGLGLSAGISSVGDGAFLVALAGITAIPIATGIAILRHHLFDIDVLINRTLVYAGLSATLAAAYLALVLLLGLVLTPVTGGSGLAVATSTLAVAALFRPARGRIQALVDRRFYRAHYDAARTLEAFGARVRDEVDLDALAGALRTVVGETMQPAHVSLWLRGTQR